MRRIVFLLSLICFLPAVSARTVRVFGYVVDDDNRSIEAVNVYTGSGADLVGTSSSRNGYYELIFDYRDTVDLTFSMVGYTAVRQRIVQPKEVINVNVQLSVDEQMLGEVEVRGVKRQEGTLDHVDAATTRVMPDATGGSIESLLITFAGVSQNNELSTQYNVRGGSFDENEVYVNGIEVYRPLLIRSGQQEGLSFVHPYMVDNVAFSAGGFDARFGDKMSSVLDIRYKQPVATEASLYMGLLGAGVYVGHGSDRFSMMHGLRYKTSRYMLGAMKTSGNYDPTYLDYQTYMSWRLTNHQSSIINNYSPWRMSLLANVSLNTYGFRPDSLAESFGGTENATSLNIWYEGQERDRFVTAFGALSVSGGVAPGVQIGFDASGFYTDEQERYDITGQYVLENAQAVAVGTYHEHARNTLHAGVVSLAHRGSWESGANRLSWGASVRGEFIRDHISEWQWRDSAGYSLPVSGDELSLFYSMRGSSSMQSARMQMYVENTHSWITPSGKWILTAGGRLQYWSFSREWLPSPRVSLTWQPGWKRDFAFRLAGGVYYQAPFYKEVRDTATVDGVTRVELNENIRAQRSYQAVLGGDYYFRAWGRPFKLSAEVYGKYMDRMESYTVDNVRVRYAGNIDSRGYTVGLDLKFYGEFVPGADSWISFSTMRSRMQLNDDPAGRWLLSPQEQRYAFTMFFQDYIPRFPALRFHIKMIWADGLPFSYPNRFDLQGRMPAYKRIDLGATYVFDRKTTKFMRQPGAKHVDNFAIRFECFNIVGWNNVNSYFWVKGPNNAQYASPNYLTGRRFNLRFSIDLK